MAYWLKWKMGFRSIEGKVCDGINTREAHIRMGDSARVMALGLVGIFLIATLVGSLFPECGNIVAKRLDMWAHSFNGIFLALGIVGIVLALYLGYRNS